MGSLGLACLRPRRWLASQEGEGAETEKKPEEGAEGEKKPEESVEGDKPAEARSYSSSHVLVARARAPRNVAGSGIGIGSGS